MPSFRILGFSDSAYGQVIGLGSTAQEYNLRRFGVDEPRHMLAGLVHERFGLLPEPVDR